MIFTVWGRLAGDPLPTSNVKVGEVWVGPGPGDFRPPEPQFMDVTQDGVVRFVGHPAYMRVDSWCWFWVKNVEARDSWEALARVNREQLPRLLAALTLSVDDMFPYRAQLTGADDGREGFSDGAVVSTAFFEPSTATEAQVSRAAHLMAQITGVKELRRAAEAFHRGTEFADQIGGKSAVAASALLAYYQCLESLAGLVSWSPPGDKDVERKAVIDRLAGELASPASIDEKHAFAKAAANDLDRIDGRFGSLRIENAARAFGLDDLWIARERQFGKLRNSKLGHSSSAPTLLELSPWLSPANLDTAPSLAARMLGAAAEWIDLQQDP